MATLGEMAEAISHVLLRSQVPEPLRVDLWNQGPAQASYLTKGVIDACSDAGKPLALVRIDPAFAADMRGATKDVPYIHALVPVECASELQACIEFYRATP